MAAIAKSSAVSRWTKFIDRTPMLGRNLRLIVETLAQHGQLRDRPLPIPPLQGAANFTAAPLVGGEA